MFLMAIPASWLTLHCQEHARICDRETTLPCCREDIQLRDRETALHCCLENIQLCGREAALGCCLEDTFLQSPVMTKSLSPVITLQDPDPAVRTSLPLSADEVKQCSWSAGIDLVSSYIWRGTRQGRGPHIQPYVEYSAGSATGGVWGTFDFHGYREVDLCLNFDLPGGFSISFQDYWMADLAWADFSAVSGSHALEAGIGYESDYVSFYAGYIFNEAGGAGSYGGDLYLESRFSFDYFTIVMGAGNGWHTEEGKFAPCCIGLESGFDIPVSDYFSIPATAQLIYNPDSRMLFLAAGLSFAFGAGD